MVLSNIGSRVIIMHTAHCHAVTHRDLKEWYVNMQNMRNIKDQRVRFDVEAEKIQYVPFFQFFLVFKSKLRLQQIKSYRDHFARWSRSTSIFFLTYINLKLNILNRF